MNTTIKAIALVAVIAVAAMALAGDGSDAVTYTDGSGIIYETSGNSATVVGWEGASSELTIPSEITVNGRDCNVNRIGAEAFMGSGLTSVTIPESVTRIDARAFYGLQIEFVDLPDKLTTLGEDAFSCNDAVKAVSIPSTVTSYAHSFSKCSSLTEITLAGGTNLKVVNGVLFNGKGDTIYQYPAGKTGSYKIPDSVTAIGAYAFSGSGIASVEIGAKVTSVNDGAFSHCDSLTGITVKDSKSFSADGGVLFDSSKKVLIAYPAGKTGASYTIPSSVTEIAESAFAGAPLQSVSFNSSLNEIGKFAFAGSALTSLSLTKGVTMGEGAFSGCTSLKKVILPSAQRTLGASVFEGCTSLETVEWASPTSGSVTIGESAFEGCTSLSSVQIPSGTTVIDDRAFAGCSSLTTVTLPGSLDEIGEEAFSGSGLEEITLPEGVDDVGAGAFSSCKSLGKATLPSTLRTVSDGMFEGCESLDDLVFSDEGLRSIGARALSGTALKDVSVPEGVTDIDETAFAGCTRLSTISLPSTLEDMGARPFTGCDAIASFAVSEESRAYSAVGGNLYSKDLKTLVRYTPASTAPEFIIPDGTTKISDGAFEGSVSLGTVQIPATVTSIGAYAFLGCSGLEQVAVASTTVSVGEGAFDLSTGEPASLEIYTDAEEFPENAFGSGTTPVYDAYNNFGIPHSDEVMGDALIWVVIAVVLGLIFLAVSVRKAKS